MKIHSGKDFGQIVMHNFAESNFKHIPVIIKERIWTAGKAVRRQERVREDGEKKKEGIIVIKYSCFFTHSAVCARAARQRAQSIAF